MPTVDAADFKTAAMTLVGAALELARTEIVASAVAERDALDAPIDHQLLPCKESAPLRVTLKASGSRHYASRSLPDDLAKVP